MKLIKKLLKENHGQDLVEYTLVLAFVALASAGLFIGAGNSTASIWGAAQSTLTNCPSGTTATGMGGNNACWGTTTNNGVTQGILVPGQY